MFAPPAIIVDVLNAPQWICQPLAPWGFWFREMAWCREDGRPVDRHLVATRLSLPEMVLAAWEFRTLARCKR